MLSRDFWISELVLERMQFASHGDVGPPEGDKNIRLAHGLQAQAASAPTLGHQILTTLLQEGIIISQMAKLRLRKVKAFGQYIREQDLKPGCVSC